MSIIVTFVLSVVILSYVFLWRNNITEQAWLSVHAAPPSSTNSPRKTKQVALIMFLAVVTSMFCLFISAYFMRMALLDWQALNDPGLLWVNSFVLLLASITLEWCYHRTGQDEVAKLRTGLLITALFSSLFVVGQLWAWQQLIDQGFYMTSNPAVAFFYLITGLHGLHILGGLYVLCRTILRVFSGIDPEKIHASISLCRIYWHSLLVIWLGLFVLLLRT